jgi:hypothetical protein
MNAHILFCMHLKNIDKMTMIKIDKFEILYELVNHLVIPNELVDHLFICDEHLRI